MSLMKLFRLARSTRSLKPLSTSLEPRRRTPVCDTRESSGSAPETIILDDPYDDVPMTDEQRQKIIFWYDKTFKFRLERPGHLPYGFVRPHL